MMMKKYQLSKSVQGRKLDYRSELNSQQLQVVTSGQGAKLVIAGPGSGKTRTLTYRVVYLLESGIAPGTIGLCTFTNKAAKEMLRRVEQLAHADAREILGGTFHHLANRILRCHANRLGFQSDYTILDRHDSLELIGTCMSEAHGRVRGSKQSIKMYPRAEVMQSLMSFSIDTQINLEDVILKKTPGLALMSNELLSVARTYRDKKRDMHVMDFDDLLFYLHRLLLEHTDIREEICAGFQHVLVDEYQDTNTLQVEVVDLLASGHGNLTVVGDDAQSIYAFRGALPSNMISFPDRWPQAQVFRLETNYRSVESVLRAANRSIRNNPNQLTKELRAVRMQGQLPAVVHVKDERMQAAFVAQRIRELNDDGVGLDDIAVLYRAHSQSLDLQVELTQRNIPYLVRSGVRFFEQAHIKDVLAYLRILQNPRDEIGWMRVLRMQPGVGKATAMSLWQAISRNQDPFKAMIDDLDGSHYSSRSQPAIGSLQTLLRALRSSEGFENPSWAIGQVLQNGYASVLPGLYVNAESRKEDIEQLAAFAAHFQSTQSFLSELNLLASFGSEQILDVEKEQERVTLSTIHQAKGLEWKVVFVLSLNEGVFPHPWALSESNADDQEERRLFYVAVTRAKDELYLVRMLTTQKANRRNVLCKPSRFLVELKGEPICVEDWNVQDS